MQYSLLTFISLACLGYVKTDFTLDILHVNDVHARFEETSVFSGRCSEQDKQNNKCFGGFARIHSKVEELRRTLPNTVFLAGGDYFQGTVWYTIHKWRPFSQFLNIMKQDVLALGNHEFDDGIEGVVPFLDNVTFPVIASNIDDTLEPSFQGKVLPYVILTRSNKRIGIVGYVTTETVAIASPGRLKFLNEVDSVRKYARELKSQGVDIIIALGHAGYTRDQEIAEKVEEVDVVVGGHTNTFLYTGSDPSTESKVDEYPKVITQSSGRKVLVVQAYAFGKYLGHLTVRFDASDEVASWNGNPILLDNTVPQDPMILEELKPWKDAVQAISGETIGRTFVFLDGNRQTCRMQECNMGDIITDAIIHQNAKYPDDMEWAATSLAVINSGGIRASINEQSSNGSISIEDVLTVLPFQNTIDIVDLKGRDVKLMFEHSVTSYDRAGIDPPGRFLQVSGFNVVYDLDKPEGSRVITLEARCVACRVPDMQPVEDNLVYQIAMPSYVANGGDGFTGVRDNKVKHHLTGQQSPVLLNATSTNNSTLSDEVILIPSTTSPAQPPKIMPESTLQEKPLPGGTLPETTVPEETIADNIVDGNFRPKNIRVETSEEDEDDFESRGTNLVQIFKKPTLPPSPYAHFGLKGPTSKSISSEKHRFNPPESQILVKSFSDSDGVKHPILIILNNHYNVQDGTLTIGSSHLSL